MKRKAYRATGVKRVDWEGLSRDREGQAVQVGFDVGKESVLTVARWGDGRFERPWLVKNPGEIGILVDLLASVARERALRLAMEPTGTYGDVLRQALSDVGLPLERVSAKAAHDYAEIFDGVPSQHDGKDAAVVAELAAAGKSTAWPYETPSETEREMAYHAVAGLGEVRRAGESACGRRCGGATGAMGRTVAGGGDDPRLASKRAREHWRAAERDRRPSHAGVRGAGALGAGRDSVEQTASEAIGVWKCGDSAAGEGGGGGDGLRVVGPSGRSVVVSLRRGVPEGDGFEPQGA